MSNSDLARRTEVQVKINGANVTDDVNKYFLSLSYTDNEEDKTDDLQLSFDDREGVWLNDWLEGGNLKGAELQAFIVQKNRNSGGGEETLDCGVFEIDGIDISGPPSQISVKATSLTYSGAARGEKKTKAWENIKLSAIANEMAKNGGMSCMFESVLDPLYERKEQIQTSDIVFLQSLCKDAGISLKATAKMLVLFDAEAYEQNPPVFTIKHGEADILSYRFSTSTNDTKYGRCRVSYTDPKTGETVEYTYTPRDADKDAPTLEINEKVKTREEARLLAMKRLRQKNKAEYSAEFTFSGDVSLVAGITAEIKDFGMFDGKYIIETASHSVSGSGYTTQTKFRRVLEGY